MRGTYRVGVIQEIHRTVIGMSDICRVSIEDSSQWEQEPSQRQRTMAHPV